MIKSLPLISIFFFVIQITFAQTKISGKILDKSTGEPIFSATILVKDAKGGATSDINGKFTITVPKLPATLIVSSMGYAKQEVVVKSVNDKLNIQLSTEDKALKTVQITESRITEKQKMAPLTVESMDLITIKETPAANFYEGLGNMKGVDLTSASIGFKVINTRGFNSTSPVRSLQIIDGVDNQSPGLNFSLGNFLGAPELDVLKVELIQGASSAFYGPNAFNGVIDIQTKDPFIHQGLAVSLKAGERNLLKGEMRYAKAFQNAAGRDVFAFKLNGAYMRANDWEATNLDPTDQSPVDASNPGGYDAVNVYGDEIQTGQDFADPSLARIYPGLGVFTRRGYSETDLVDYDTENLKGNRGRYYNLPSDVRIMGGFNFGSGTTVYQGENRFRLDGIFFWQGKMEVSKKDKFFLRAYITEEDAGKSYDAYATALQLQTAAKTLD